MSVSYLEKKSSISLVIAIILAVLIFIISWKFNEKVGIKYEFLIFFLFMLSVLSYSIKGKSKKVSTIIWPIIFGIAYSVFDKSYGTVVLKYPFNGTLLWVNITAIFSATLLYLLVIAHRKNILWKGKDDGTHEKEVLRLAKEKDKEQKDIKKNNNKDTKKESKGIKKDRKKEDKVDKEESKEKHFNKNNLEVDEDTSYFYVGDEDIVKEKNISEKDLGIEMSEILDNFEDEDEIEDEKIDPRENASMDFEREISENERY